MVFALFLAGKFRKISLKIFEQEMTKIFEIFSKYFWPKITWPYHMIFKEHIRNMWSFTRKAEGNILKSVFCWFETNDEKNLRRNKAIFIMFGTFFKNFIKFDEFENLNSNSKFSKNAMIWKFSDVWIFCSDSNLIIVF